VNVEAVLKLPSIVESVTVLADNERLVASRTEIPLRELPVTVQTVTADLIQQQGATDLVRALYNVPGTNSVLLYGVYEYYIFRGFGFDNIVGSSVLLDGLRQEGNRINSQLNFIESVEVLKGPSSMLYGTEAVGGTINLVRKKPVSTPNYELLARGGRWGYAGAEVGATGPLNRSQNLLYRVDAGFNRADGFRDAGWRRSNISPAVHWRATKQDQLNFYAILTFDNYDADAGFPLLRGANEPNPFRATTIPNIPLTTRFSTPSDFQKTRDAIPQMFWTHSFNDNVRLRNAFSYRLFNDQYLVAETLTHNPAQTPNQIDRELFYFFHHRRPLLNQTDVVGTVKKGWEHQLVGGYEFARYDNTTDRSSSVFGIAVPPISLLNPGVQPPFAGPTSFPISRRDNFVNRTNAVYFQDFIRINPRLTALFSGRYDNFQRDARRNPVVNNVETIGPLTQISQTPFTYRAALNAQATKWMGLYASYGTSFRAQT
jgi:iron complex outermembrane recepter protein